MASATVLVLPEHLRSISRYQDGHPHDFISFVSLRLFQTNLRKSATVATQTTLLDGAAAIVSPWLDHNPIERLPSLFATVPHMLFTTFLVTIYTGHVELLPSFTFPQRKDAIQLVHVALGLGGSLDTVQYFHGRGHDVSKAITYAVKASHVDIVNFLAPLCPARVKDQALLIAARENRPAIVRCLWGPHVPPDIADPVIQSMVSHDQTETSTALRAAVFYGHVALATSLLNGTSEYIHVSHFDISQAVSNGHLEVLQLWHARDLPRVCRHGVPTASTYGRLPMLQWFLAMQTPTSRLEMIQLARKISTACGHGHIESWLRGQPDGPTLEVNQCQHERPLDTGASEGYFMEEQYAASSNFDLEEYEGVAWARVQHYIWWPVRVCGELRVEHATLHARGVSKANLLVYQFGMHTFEIIEKDAVRGWKSVDHVKYVHGQARLQSHDLLVAFADAMEEVEEFMAQCKRLRHNPLQVKDATTQVVPFGANAADVKPTMSGVVAIQHGSLAVGHVVVALKEKGLGGFQHMAIPSGMRLFEIQCVAPSTGTPATDHSTDIPVEVKDTQPRENVPVEEEHQADEHEAPVVGAGGRSRSSSEDYVESEDLESESDASVFSPRSSASEEAELSDVSGIVEEDVDDLPQQLVANVMPTKDVEGPRSDAVLLLPPTASPETTPPHGVPSLLATTSAHDTHPNDTIPDASLPQEPPLHPLSTAIEPNDASPAKDHMDQVHGRDRTTPSRASLEGATPPNEVPRDSPQLPCGIMDLHLNEDEAADASIHAMEARIVHSIDQFDMHALLPPSPPPRQVDDLYVLVRPNKYTTRHAFPAKLAPVSSHDPAANDKEDAPNDEYPDLSPVHTSERDYSPSATSSDHSSTDEGVDSLAFDLPTTTTQSLPPLNDGVLPPSTPPPSLPAIDTVLISSSAAPHPSTTHTANVHFVVAFHARRLGIRLPTAAPLTVKGFASPTCEAATSKRIQEGDVIVAVNGKTIDGVGCNGFVDIVESLARPLVLTFARRKHTVMDEVLGASSPDGQCSLGDGTDEEDIVITFGPGNLGIVIHDDFVPILVMGFTEDLPIFQPAAVGRIEKGDMIVAVNETPIEDLGVVGFIDAVAKGERPMHVTFRRKRPRPSPTGSPSTEYDAPKRAKIAAMGSSDGEELALRDFDTVVSFGQGPLGFTIAKTHRCIQVDALFMDEGLPAALDRIAEGDILLDVNGRPATELGVDGIMDLVASDVRPLTITFRRILMALMAS
ncbi:Aste57867_3306 [Aphanomyces stellatus]|uniref:Aste57867_3306 protein n=1 Tax=Aphanomyces stellatus TaxID=120398 RepID=A0A485K9E1_9STRA|nr:hypothetical protein As57867_003296 [Aphanomyces stellatus]VFT80476.1 Aste57867_3306 [Aphanomyces stellatus]